MLGSTWGSVSGPDTLSACPCGCRDLQGPGEDTGGTKASDSQRRLWDSILGGQASPEKGTCRADIGTDPSLGKAPPEARRTWAQRQARPLPLLT